MIWMILLVLIIGLGWYMMRLTDTGRMIAKGVMIYLLGAGCVIAVIVFVASIGIAAGMVKENSVADRMEFVEYSYYNGDYGDMRETLFLNDCFEEAFAPYWEIAEAEQTYHEYLIYEKAAAQNGDEREEYEKRMADSREKLLMICQNSVFEQNRTLLARYADFVK